MTRFVIPPLPEDGVPSIIEETLLRLADMEESAIREGLCGEWTVLPDEFFVEIHRYYEGFIVHIKVKPCTAEQIIPNDYERRYARLGDLRKVARERGIL